MIRGRPALTEEQIRQHGAEIDALQNQGLKPKHVAAVIGITPETLRNRLARLKRLTEETN